MYSRKLKERYEVDMSLVLPPSYSFYNYTKKRSMSSICTITKLTVLSTMIFHSKQGNNSVVSLTLLTK